MIFTALALSASFSGFVLSAAMSDTTAGAQRTMESAFILPLTGQITQTMDPASRNPNLIPTVDSGHSPSMHSLEKKKKKQQKKKTFVHKTKEKRREKFMREMKGNILYLGEHGSR